MVAESKHNGRQYWVITPCPYTLLPLQYIRGLLTNLLLGGHVATAVDGVCDRITGGEEVPVVQRKQVCDERLSIAIGLVIRHPPRHATVFQDGNAAIQATSSSG